MKKKFALEAADIDDLKKLVKNNVIRHQGRDPARIGKQDLYLSLAYSIREMLVEKWISTQQSYYKKKQKRVYYLSLEFLIGRSLGNSLINLGLYDQVAKVIKELGFDLDEIRDEEEDAALGNGGLGRLAACFMDSFATLKIPAYGYGILYEYGLFNQKLVDGHQIESPDNWLRFGSPWVFSRSHPLYPVHFYGKVNSYTDDSGNFRKEWIETETVMACPCDLLVPGYKNENVVNMRLWSARASRELDLSSFSKGDYFSAVNNKVRSETISKVLYPADESPEGRELRLKQQYFFVAATFQDIFRRYKKGHDNFDKFSDETAVQLNDTHPAIAIPELMRLLLDIEGINWEKAWDICVKTFAYTNHTLMPEALETIPVDMLKRVLPRHLEIIYEINFRFLNKVSEKFDGSPAKIKDMSLISEEGEKYVRMAHLAIVGSHSVNGVAALHTELLKNSLFKDFEEFYPGKINNKTNGITPRRWLLKSNRKLSELISSKIGDSWITKLDDLRKIEKLSADSSFQEKIQNIKRENKVKLARVVQDLCDVTLDPDSMYDIQVKRIHEYKRQLLNLLHAIVLYHRIIKNPDDDIVPRTIIFAGKAAPSYWKAKMIIRLISSVADMVNKDPRVGDKLRIVYIPNYSVSLAEKIIPAADLSEQISTAGTEASGTGNMKFSLNGALTIGTLDGANIEIREEVGKENIFIFGLTAEQVEWERRNPSRTPLDVYLGNEEIKYAVDMLRKGAFCKSGDNEWVKYIIDDLLEHYRDPYLILLDVEDYIRCQEEVNENFLNKGLWTKKSILNIARMGKFSSDRTIRDYATRIWGVEVD
ncbi:MAG: glycogen/starch/alpha-glucan phosphorylase [Nitrospinota bacterium]